ncbi:MAG TPA: FAD-dependent oxidoreductase [Rhizomicrobium sp.]|nr:FAD-dependent oxidoreductase [Rhizomicrobium sp.]
MAMSNALDRRRLLRGTAAFAGLGALAGCTTLAKPATVAPPTYERIALAPIRARTDRLFDITVCLRPFRAAGPRIEVEQVGSKRVVHNYGHGGSGWSLSWGSGTLAVSMAMEGSPREIAVIGCGALGLTSAILAQNAGAKVTIYARDLLPDTRSSRATGSWTPDSRIALTGSAAPGFAARWEEMARISFKTYRRYLGLPGNPVTWVDRYSVSDLTLAQIAARPSPPDQLGFAEYRDSISDLVPGWQILPPESTPFHTNTVRRTSTMMFNIADYGHTLMSDFLAAGGKFVRAEFHSLADVAHLKEKVVINCPGYAARELCKDESVVPVRGQIAWLIPQPEVTYSVVYDGISTYPRSDGIVVQYVGGGDIDGYNDANETPNRAEAETAVKKLAPLFDKFG